MLGTVLNGELRAARVRNKTAGSRARFERAQQSLALGVSSAVRRDTRPYPLYFECGLGSRITDVDGNSYLDYGLAWGPLILGHAPPEILEAVTRQLQKGFTFGAQHDLEFEVAEKLIAIIPCADAVCFANSGSEAVQLALRLARAATGRKKVLKFEGHYHGSTEGILVSYHPTPTQIAAAEGDPIPVGPGQVPPDHVIVTEWNSVAGVEEAFAFTGSEIAAVICEPLLCNSGCIPPLPGFLDFLRRITERHHTVLIFDEVITGFRLDLRGAQGYYEVTPDLATYGKAVGGGVPVSVLAGRSELMSLISERKVVHMGTLNGNPFSLSAVRATLDVLSRDDGAIFSDLHRRGKRLREGLQRHLQAKGLQVVTSGEGPVFQLSFMDKPPTNYRQTLAADRAIYSDFAVSLLDEGYLSCRTAGGICLQRILMKMWKLPWPQPSLQLSRSRSDLSSA